MQGHMILDETTSNQFQGSKAGGEDWCETQLEMALEFEKLIYQQAYFLHESTSRNVSLENANGLGSSGQFAGPIRKKKTTVLCDSEDTFINTLKKIKEDLLQQQFQNQNIFRNDEGQPALTEKQVYHFTGTSDENIFAEVSDQLRVELVTEV